MHKILILTLIFLLSISTSHLNYLRNESFKIQKLLLYDLNNGFYNYDLDQIHSLEVNYPSLSINTIPLKALKARYLTYYGQNQQALSLLESSLKENPFSQYTLYLISIEYYKTGRLTTSLEYLRKGFEINQNTPYLSSFYFSLLSSLNLKKELTDAFDKIIESNNPEIWKFYYLSIIELSDPDQDFIHSVVKTASKKLNLTKLEFNEFTNK